MIGITQDAIKVGDMITRESWSAPLRVIRVDVQGVVVLSDVSDNMLRYHYQTGWYLVSREQSQYRRIIL